MTDIKLSIDEQVKTLREMLMTRFLEPEVPDMLLSDPRVFGRVFSQESDFRRRADFLLCVPLKHTLACMQEDTIYWEDLYDVFYRIDLPLDFFVQCLSQADLDIRHQLFTSLLSDQLSCRFDIFDQFLEKQLEHIDGLSELESDDAFIQFCLSRLHALCTDAVLSSKYCHIISVLSMCLLMHEKESATLFQQVFDACQKSVPLNSADSIRSAEELAQLIKLSWVLSLGSAVSTHFNEPIQQISHRFVHSFMKMSKVSDILLMIKDLPTCVLWPIMTQIHAYESHKSVQFRNQSMNLIRIFDSLSEKDCVKLKRIKRIRLSGMTAYE